MTRVSVGVPVFDGEAYLQEALASLVGQTHADLDIVISDNASTDGTEEICREFARSDPRIRYVRQATNIGSTPNHNFVLAAAQAPYFRWLAYDDRMDPRCVEACATVLDERPDVVLSWPRTRIIDEHGAFVRLSDDVLPWDGSSPSGRLRSLLGPPLERSLLQACHPIYGLVRRDAIRASRPLQSYRGSDTVLLVELALRGGWSQVPEPLFENRRHEESSVVAMNADELRAWMDPRSRGGYSMPEARQFAGYLRAILEVPMPAAERRACLGILRRWLVGERRWRVIGGELRIRASERLGARRVAGSAGSSYQR